MNQGQTNHILYTPELIAFAQSGVRFASLLEQLGSKYQFASELIQVLPRLYGLATTLPKYGYDIEMDFIEEYISESRYEQIRSSIAELLGDDDVYLGIPTEDIGYSEGLVAMHLSEQLADIYQHIGNLLGILKEENTIALPAAIGRCLYYWQEHWGASLVAALGNLHQLYLGLRDEVDEDELESLDDYDTLNDEDY